MLVIGIDPSTTETGIVAIDTDLDKVVYKYVIDTREKRYGKNGQELKTKGKFNVEEFVYQLKKYINEMNNNGESVIILPKMSGALNYNTIEKLSRLCGIIYGIVALTNIKVLYINENSARSRELKNVDAETYKEKAMKLSGFDNDNLADAYVLAKSFIDFGEKEKELFKEF